VNIFRIYGISIRVAIKERYMSDSMGCVGLRWVTSDLNVECWVQWNA
jgi:hypothetical protein